MVGDHLLDAEGDPWVERENGKFQVPHALPEHNHYTLEQVIDWWGIQDEPIVWRRESK